MIGRWLRAWRAAGQSGSAAAATTVDWFPEWWASARTESPRFYTTLSASAIEVLRRSCADRVETTRLAADRILRHEFDLLGSGPYIPADADRPRTSQGYVPIDWRLDPRSSLRFPPSDFDHSSWNLMTMRPGLADIKLPWELARCQHWLTLGQAWQLTRDSRYAAEIADELDDFMEANPVGRGIQWTCTMDVALRAVNWALAIELVRDAEWPLDRIRRMHEAVYAHGVFIRSNLEDRYEVTSNHYLSNLVGLYYLGFLFERTAPGAAWLDFAERGLATETDKQILPDGADFESAIPYHRLVAELILGCLRLGEWRGRSLPDRVHERVRDMVTYLVGLLRPDGLMPVVGDADDGRLHVLTDYGRWDPQDARHLLGAAGALYGEDAWKGLSTSAGRWEAAWWGFDVSKWPPDAWPAGAPALFPEAGVAVLRDATQYLLVTNGRVGTNGFGNHKHNDQLSFEYHLEGAPIVVDPGSYVYTGDPAARNLFRSVRSHSTVAVDEREQNEVNPEWLFRMFAHEPPEHLEWTPSSLTYVGRHRGYTRFEGGVIHSRAFRLLPDVRAVAWVDRLSGAGPHRCTWHLHWAPGVTVNGGVEGTVLDAAAGRLRLLAPKGLDVTHGTGAYSPSYGVKRPCATTDMSAEVTLAPAATFAFALAPESVLGAPGSAETIRRAHADLQGLLP